MQPEWSCWHRGTGPWARSSWHFAVPVARAVHPSGGWGSWGCGEQAGCRFSRMASCSPLFLQFVPTTEPPALPGEWRGAGGVTGAVQSLPAWTIPGFCGSAVTGTVLLSSLQGHRSWPSSLALTCRRRQGAIERHGKGQCSLHSAFVGSQVKPDVCI